MAPRAGGFVDRVTDKGTADLGRAAALGDVGHDLVLEVDFGAIEVQVGLAVGQDLHAVAFHDFIVVRTAFGQVEDIGEARATAAFYANAKRDRFRKALILD